MEKLKENLPYVLGGVAVGFGLAKVLGGGGEVAPPAPPTKKKCCGGSKAPPAATTPAGPLSQAIPLPTDGVTVVLGAQWGDEGKGKLTDILAQDAQVVARCAGGNNAGHTIVVGGVKYDFHVVPSGIISPGATSVIGNGVVIHLEQFFKEIDHNIAIDKAGGATNMVGWQDRLLISDRAHVVLDIHQTIDGLLEEEKGGKKVGTTKRGIGPCYAAKMARVGIRVGELYGPAETLAAKYVALIKGYQMRHPSLQVDVEADLAKMHIFAAKMKPMVVDTIPWIHSVLGTKKVLVEGANAAMLDIDFGTYPYVTSSNPTIGSVSTGLGIPPKWIKHVYGVVKAYSTRVGAGGFPTELSGELETKLRKIGHEYGVTTKRPRRCGWLDLVVLEHSCRVNGYTSIMLTKLDCLDTFPEIKVGTRYKLNGEYLPGSPADADCLEDIEMEYDTLVGWNSCTEEIRDARDLPQAAKDYIAYIERKVGVPIQWVGVGPAREATLRLF